MLDPKDRGHYGPFATLEAARKHSLFVLWGFSEKENDQETQKVS